MIRRPVQRSLVWVRRAGVCSRFLAEDQAQLRIILTLETFEVIFITYLLFTSTIDRAF